MSSNKSKRGEDLVKRSIALSNNNKSINSECKVLSFQNPPNVTNEKVGELETKLLNMIGALSNRVSDLELNDGLLREEVKVLKEENLKLNKELEKTQVLLEKNRFELSHDIEQFSKDLADQSKEAQVDAGEQEALHGSWESEVQGLNTQLRSLSTKVTKLDGLTAGFVSGQHVKSMLEKNGVLLQKSLSKKVKIHLDNFKNNISGDLDTKIKSCLKACDQRMEGSLSRFQSNVSSMVTKAINVEHGKMLADKSFSKAPQVSLQQNKEQKVLNVVHKSGTIMNRGRSANSGAGSQRSSPSSLDSIDHSHLDTLIICGLREGSLKNSEEEYVLDIFNKTFTDRDLIPVSAERLGSYVSSRNTGRFVRITLSHRGVDKMLSNAIRRRVDAALPGSAFIKADSSSSRYRAQLAIPRSRPYARPQYHRQQALPGGRWTFVPQPSVGSRVAAEEAAPAANAARPAAAVAPAQDQ